MFMQLCSPLNAALIGHVTSTEVNARIPSDNFHHHASFLFMTLMPKGIPHKEKGDQTVVEVVKMFL